MVGLDPESLFHFHCSGNRF